MLRPCAQLQRHATACCAYRPTFSRCLSKPSSSSSFSSYARSCSESTSQFTALALNKPSSSSSWDLGSPQAGSRACTALV